MLRKESLATLQEFGSQNSGFFGVDGWSFRDERPPDYATRQSGELRWRNGSSYALSEHRCSSTSSHVLEKTPRETYQLQDDLDAAVLSHELPHMKFVRGYSRHP